MSNINSNYPRVVLAGTSSGVGKTTLTVGIILALVKKGLIVQPFKAGPDYIDPTYHTLASGRVCRNLDSWMLPRSAIMELFEQQAKSADISIIEGVMGLYDGSGDKEDGSTAHLAKLLDSPVILIVDSGSVSTSAAALVLGYKEFDKSLALKGVILNNIASPSHYSNMKKAIEKKTHLPVLGFLPRDKSLTLPERHLGLVPTDEKALIGLFLEKLLGLVEKNIEIDRITEISRKALRPFPCIKKRLFNAKPTVDNRVTIAVAKDASFNFYYQDNLDILSHYGASLIEFSPLKDKALPHNVCGVYIGGGFPELFAGRLSRNNKLKDDIYQKAKSGMPIYAECGGLMFLMKDLIDFRNRGFPMVGIFGLSVKMGKRLHGCGYVNIEVTRRNILSDKGDEALGHIFHWSYLVGSSKKDDFAYRMRKTKCDVILDGLVRWNVLASYAHLHFGSNVRFARNFIKSCLDYTDKRIR